MAAALPHRRLGGSEIEVSRIALGSWRTFERMPRADAERLLAYALGRGIDFLDDARYDDETGKAPIPTGYSEVLFGELLRAVGADPAALTISNKLWWEFWPGQDAIGEVEASLQRMGLERLGLLYSSTLPAEVPVPVAVEQIAAVLATGRVGAWAVVNWSAADLAAATAEARGRRSRRRARRSCRTAWPGPTGSRTRPWSDALAAAGASLIPSAALAGGALSGKYADGAAGRLSDELNDPRRPPRCNWATRSAARPPRWAPPRRPSRSRSPCCIRGPPRPSSAPPPRLRLTPPSMPSSWPSASPPTTWRS